MKNFLKTISVLCMLVFVSFTFVGCDDKKPDKFYENTNLKFNTFITEVCQNDNYKNGLIYGQTVTEIINNINNNNPDYEVEKYQEIYNHYLYLNSIYDKIFVNSFKYLADFKDVFNATDLTKANKNAKNEYKKFEQSLDEMKKHIENISDDVTILDQNVRSSTNLLDVRSDLSLDALKVFKNKYVKLSEELINVCNNLLNLCENYIYTKYDTYKQGDTYITLTPTELINQRTIVALKTVVNTLTPTIKYLNAFDGNYYHLDTDHMFDKLDLYLNLDLSKNDTITVQELENWQNIFKAYTNDTQNFYTSLEKINFADFKKEFNCDKDAYLQEFPINEAYINKIFDFTSTNVDNLYSALNNLCI